MTVRIGTVETLHESEILRIAAPDPEAGLGALGTERGNLPLESIEVRSSVVGLTVRTEVAQGFRNPYDVPLEATYVFPLPDRAAVTGLRMEADGRVVEGVLEERGQARAHYEQALAEGRRASIAEEERPGVFTMRVGNILPGEHVVIRATLAGRLPFEDGEATYRFPLVVAPRYIPGTALPGEQVGDGTGPDTDAVPDASRISPPILLPGFPNPVRLSVEVDLDPAGLPLTAIRSSLHGVEVTAPDGADDASGRRLIRLVPGERLDRDFILRLGLGSEDAVATSLAVRLDDVDANDTNDENDTGDAGTDAPARDRAGTFVLTVLPPNREHAGAHPRDVVLVLDRSGSMGGWKMVAARRAAGRIVDTLTGADRFAVLAFDDMIESAPLLPSGLVEASDRHRFRAIEHLAGLEARGGTEMAAALRRAADLLAGAPGEARDRVLVLVTDGQVGNEDQILEQLAPRIKGVRIHTIGIDRTVNAAFLERLARISGGRCELVESEDRLDEAMAQIHRRIGAPVATGLSLVGAGLAVDLASVEPARLPDLFVGAPLVVSGRFTGAPAGEVVVRGTGADGEPWQTSVTAVAAADAGLAAYWARGRVRDLEDGFASGHGGEEAERAIVRTSLRFGVLCRFTAFVAVDSRVVNQSGAMRRATQPVDSPSGWGAAGETSWVAASARRPAVSRRPRADLRSALQMPSAPLPSGGPMLPGAPAMPAAAAAVTPLAEFQPQTQPWIQPEMKRAKAQLEPFLEQADGVAVPAQASSPAGVSLTEVWSRLLVLRERLHAESAAPFADRVALLRELAGVLRELTAPPFLSTPENLQILTELAAQLELPLADADQAELERRWQQAVSGLATVTGAPEPRRAGAFWKRRAQN